MSVSSPPVQDFPSLVLQLQATLNAGNENKNSQRVGVLVFRHSDRPDEHNDETHIINVMSLMTQGNSDAVDDSVLFG